MISSKICTQWLSLYSNCLFLLFSWSFDEGIYRGSRVCMCSPSLLPFVCACGAQCNCRRNCIKVFVLHWKVTVLGKGEEVRQRRSTDHEQLVPFKEGNGTTLYWIVYNMVDLKHKLFFCTERNALSLEEEKKKKGESPRWLAVTSTTQPSSNFRVTAKARVSYQPVEQKNTSWTWESRVWTFSSTAAFIAGHMHRSSSSLKRLS